MDCLTFDIREILNNSKIKVYLVEDKVDIYNDIARVMANKLKENNDKEIKTSFILPVGPREQYQRFARICNLEKISCKNLITINMDEYLTDNENYIAEDNPLSFRGFMKKNFFNILDNKLKIKIENIFFPDPKNTNEINEVIDQIGGVDTAFGGVGINGHIAFNEPIDEKIISHNEFRNLKTRIVDLSEDTILMNSLQYGGCRDIIPKKCITIGMKEIFKANELRFYLEHKWQFSVIKKIIFTQPTPAFPATYLKEHRRSSITLSKNVVTF